MTRCVYAGVQASSRRNLPTSCTQGYMKLSCFHFKACWCPKSRIFTTQSFQVQTSLQKAGEGAEGKPSALQQASMQSTLLSWRGDESQQESIRIGLCDLQCETKVLLTALQHCFPPPSTHTKQAKKNVASFFS